MKITHRHLFLGLALIAVARPCRAAVIDSSDVGFTVKHTISVTTPPDKTYRTVVNAVGQWWDSQHTFSGDAQNLYIEPRAGGCFCEKLPRGGSVQHMRVVFADQGRTLNLSGGLGPLQALAVAGSMAWDFSASDHGTKIQLTYAVGGYFPGGPQTLPSAVDAVLGQQLTRLKTFLETGRPVK